MAKVMRNAWDDLTPEQKKKRVASMLKVRRETMARRARENGQIEVVKKKNAEAKYRATVEEIPVEVVGYQVTSKFDALGSLIVAVWKQL